MDDNELKGVLVFILITGVLGILIGSSVGTPDELENGCIVHKNKIYCVKE